MERLDEYLILLVSLFAIASPFAAVPVFISLTRGKARTERLQIPWRTATASFVTLVVAYFVGESLLRFFSISIASLRIAGGLVILATAWSMLQARSGMAVLTRLMGLILAALAVEIMTSGIGTKFPGLLH